MQKLLNYIAHGKGAGVFLLFVLAFVMGLYLAISTHVVLTDSIPFMQRTADKILPLKVENGQLVVPSDTIKRINILADEDVDAEDNKPYMVVVDPTIDVQDDFDFSNGIYLTRSYIYVVGNGQVKRTKLEADFDLPQGDYTDTFKIAIQWVSIFIAVSVLIAGFFVYLILTLFYAICAGLAAKLNKRALDFDVKMRLSSVLFCILYIVLNVLRLVGLNIPLLGFFILMIIGQILLVKRLPA